MLKKIIATARKILPEPFIGFILALARPVHGFTGDFLNYSDALSHCKGYEDKSIVKTYEQQLIKSLSNSNDRDFFIEDRSIRILSSSLFALNRLGIVKDAKILDFGGSWGNHFFHVFNRISPQVHSEYVICESEKVSIELSKIESPFKFICNLNGVADKYFDVCLASCVLPYLEKPFEILTEISRTSKYIILDRMPVVREIDKNVLTVQRSFHSFRDISSYPAYFFSRKRLFDKFHELNLQVQFEWLVKEDAPFFSGSRQTYTGFLLKTQF